MPGWNKTCRNSLAVIFLLGMVMLSACRKTLPELVYEYLPTGTAYDIQSVLVISPDTLLICGGDRFRHGFIGLSTDGGMSWQIDSVADKELYHLVNRPNGRISAIGYDGYFYESDFGGPWHFYRLPEWDALYSAVVLPDNHLIAVGGGVFSDGIALRMTPYHHIDTLHKGYDYTLNAIAHVEGERLVAAGFGAVMLSHNGGLTWALQDVGGDFFQCIDFPTPQTGYMAGATGSILQSTDGGLSWEKIRNANNPLVKNADIRDMVFTSAQTGYLIGQNGLFWKTEDGARSWTKYTLGSYHFRSIRISGNFGYLAGEHGVLIRIEI